MTENLLGKTAVVTGAGQGIGREVALRLAKAGANVVIAEYNPQTAKAVASEVDALDRRSLAYPIDIGDVPAVEVMFAQVVETFGHLDILVNNAGVNNVLPFLQMTETVWDNLMRINLRGTFFCMQAGAKQMCQQVPDQVKTAGKADACYGKIVNLTSISGQGPRPLAPHYAASKAAIINLNLTAAMALAPYGINVNAVSPGVVVTPMWDHIDLEYGKLSGAKPGESMAAFIDRIPLKRPIMPEDVANAILFLCSPESDNITGQTLNVDGGLVMR